jgi:PAS domain S-box-containing protein
MEPREDALTQEDLFRLIVESAHEYAIFATDVRGIVVSWNTGAERLFGFREDEILGVSAEVLFTPEDRAANAPERELARAAETGRAEDERWHTRKDGSRFWASGITFALLDDAGSLRGFAKIARDQTERELLRAEIARRERNFETLVANLPDIVSRFDRSLRCIFTSPAAETVTGMPLDFLVGKTHEEMGMPVEMREVADASLRRVFETGMRDTVEFSIPSPHGIRHFEAYAVPELGSDGQVETVLTVSRDVTNRREAMRDLRLSEERFRLAMLAVSGLVYDWDVASGTVYRSEGLYDLLGFHPDEAPPSHSWWIERLHPDDRARFEAGLPGLFASDRMRYESEYRIRHRDGAWVDVSDRGSLVRDDEGRVVRVVGSATDVSERKRAEAERERLLTEAREASQLKDEFLATISHELRTPLNSIVGWTRLLLSGAVDASRERRALETIERNARAQTQMVDDILDVSRIITGKLRLDLKRLDLAAVLGATVESIHPTADAKGIRVETRVEAEETYVHGDAERLQQVIWNLLSNAVKFTPKGGTVSTRIDRVGPDVRLTVADSGEGISPAFLPYVFDRFRQADSSTTRKYGGLGLGLAIVRQLVEMHGGRVAASSEGEGRGATIAVTLPAVEGGRSAARADAAVTDPSARLAGLRLLVVDDDGDARELVRVALEQRGVSVETVATAAEALERIERARPDVLVSDIGLPATDGYELIARVRALEPERGGRTPAIALTAYARDEDRARALAAGYDLHLAKPADVEALADAVARLAGRSAL